MTLDNALPGQKTSTTFSISVEKTDVKIPYTIFWDITTNTFNDGSLYYSLAKSNNSSSVSGSQASTTEEQQVPKGTTKHVIGNGELGISSGQETHEYTLTLHFKETGSDQNSDQGKSFSGKVEVQVGTNNTTESSLYYDYSNSTGTTSAPSSEG